MGGECFWEENPYNKTSVKKGQMEWWSKWVQGRSDKWKFYVGENGRGEQDYKGTERWEQGRVVGGRHKKVRGVST